MVLERLHNVDTRTPTQCIYVYKLSLLIINILHVCVQISIDIQYK